ncbi:hypothetical protein [Streptomyces lydicus]|uniref:hypothetical protein n=1 Tax=Streptomyces lydicus TaxID=47763 RepID=UPI0037154441
MGGGGTREADLWPEFRQPRPPGRLRPDIEALHARLDAAQAATALPDAPAARDALHDLIVRARLDGAVAPTGRRAAASAER